MKLVKSIKEDATFLITSIIGLLLLGVIYGFREMLYWSAVMMAISLPVIMLVVVYRTFERFGKRDALVIIKKRSPYYLTIIAVFILDYIFILDNYLRKYILALDSVIIVGLLVLAVLIKVFKNV
ncbi:hypothetical protein OB69_07145 [Roseivirga seohaensis subsp. aquiponti]|uniref:Uncharacterized protein n=1 Tax=Roseivirga seohaensis subsp. aquiponti TaxID=1566026 RepID=A0A0L8AKZ0_9BACT|nr:hypothetical protein [Roseivirga seohaensis]KOF03103.1 hypothetical protein OB69_07145 [Roseivirga seohaensis subsp. aquiponti]